MQRADSGPRARGMWTRCSVLCGSAVVGCSIQPLPPQYPLQPHTSGCHFVTIVFVNFHTILWQDADSSKARGESAILVFDSLRSATPASHLSVIQDALRAYIVQEALAKHAISYGVAVAVVASIEWQQVGWAPSRAQGLTYRVVVPGSIVPDSSLHCRLAYRSKRWVASLGLTCVGYLRRTTSSTFLLEWRSTFRQMIDAGWLASVVGLNSTWLVQWIIQSWRQSVLQPCATC